MEYTESQEVYKTSHCFLKNIIAQENNLGKCANNQNGNLRWHLPLGVRPPPLPLMAQISRHFLPHFFLLQLNPTYMKRILHFKNDR